MKDIKNIIKEERVLFELDLLPKGHKERFFQKMESEWANKELFNSQRKPSKSRLYKYYIAAAMVLAIIIISPLFKSNSSKDSQEIIVNNYVTIINEKSAVILSMIETLDPVNKEMIISTLDQLVFEAIPFGEQLPQNIDSQQRDILEQSYYNPKIEGMEKLKGYVSQLLEI